jgi:hypothetical protein
MVKSVIPASSNFAAEDPPCRANDRDPQVAVHCSFPLDSSA